MTSGGPIEPAPAHGALSIVPAAGAGREAVATASAAARLRGDWLAVVHLDGVRRAREASLRIRDALAFPDYVGTNWDAFDEAVRDLEWLPARPRFVVIDGAAAVAASDHEGWQTFVDVLLGAVRMHAATPTPLHVFVLV